MPSAVLADNDELAEQVALKRDAVPAISGEVEAHTLQGMLVWGFGRGAVEGCFLWITSAFRLDSDRYGLKALFQAVFTCSRGAYS